MRNRRGWRFGIALLLLLLALSPALAEGPGVTIDNVGGRKIVDGEVKGTLFGKVPVQGTALLSAPGEEPEPARPLVADAGDSAFAPIGQSALLLGSGFGGSEPYTFAWSSTAGTIEGADSPTAALLTEGLAPGTYDVTLTITDQAGASATDTVKVVLFQPESRELLNETELDPTPGALNTGVPGTIEFPFEVPPATTRIDAQLSHLIETNDYDLRLLDPQGNSRAFGGQFIPNNVERASVPNPEPGQWTAVVEKFATVADEVTVVITGTVAPAGDPRPVVGAGGPYRFLLGEAQSLVGEVSGGTAPLSIGWDTDQDGLVDREGATISTDFPAGRHLVTLKVTDASGLERRQTVSVLVADAERLAAETTPITVIAINDTGINPYHLEFSATTYPDPDVLALTRNFTAHPSEYIPGYPVEARPLPITLGQGYFPAADGPIWTNDTINPGELYWIPGTKIVGAMDAGGSTGTTSGTDAHPILDDNGHGSGAASVSLGNRYGYCPTCLLVVVEALDEAPASQMSWVDISSNSFGYIGGIPIGPVLGPNEETRTATERGQLTFFAAGNGVGNAFDVPQITYGSDQTGNDWVITVGAIRRDNQRAIVGDGIPVHISAWGDGNLPSACRTGTVSQCAFGGTSAATPYTAGVFGTVLTEVRRQVGDGAAGQKPGQVVAEGFPVAGSDYLEDGQLTRAELREVVLKSAVPLNQNNDASLPIYPYPLTAPYAGDLNVLFEGYGAATPETARRAIDVLLGRAPLPDRSFEDAFFELDRQLRDSLYGGYDRDGDGVRDHAAPLGAFGLDPAELTTVEAALQALHTVAADNAPAISLDQTLGANDMRFYLHRLWEGEPDATPSCSSNVQFMDQSNSDGDRELCFDSRITTVLAAYRPVGMFPSTSDLSVPLPAGSTVTVDLYIAAETPTVVRPVALLMATDREIGRGEALPAPVAGSGVGGTLCETLGEGCWTRYTFQFETTRPAIPGEQLTFQVQLLGTRSWAFGYEGAHASSITIEPAPLPPTGFEFGARIDSPQAGETVPPGNVTAVGVASFPDLGSDPTGAGDHPTSKRVEVSVDDATFAAPIEATLDEASGSWSAPLGQLEPGAHTIYVRAAIDRSYSEVATRTFTVEEPPTPAYVEWQVVAAGTQPSASNWQPATGLVPYNFELDTRAYGKGQFDIVVRLVENGEQTAITSVRARFR